MPKKKREQWGTPRTYVALDGAEVEQVTEYVGYSFEHYRIRGTRQQIESEIEHIKRAFPPQGYGGLYPWPPEKYPHLNPSRVFPLDDERWECHCSHSNSCE